MSQVKILFLVCLLGIPFHLAVADENANSIVTKADALRAPEGSYEFSAIVTSYEGINKTAENGYKVHIKDLDHTLVEFRSPASEKGKSLLMLGDDLWIYLPNVKKPVRIPLNQRLLGDVANGDMARSNFSHDYDAVLSGSEAMGGEDCFVLDLTAKSPNKTYNKVKYWVSKKDYHPVKAEFFTVSGKSLKVCTFEDFRMEAGAMRPMRLNFQDSLQADKHSIMILTEMSRKKLDDSMFTKDYMKTFE
jgi:outer membrane lipoprotein-sorting protein